MKKLRLLLLALIAFGPSVALADPVTMGEDTVVLAASALDAERTTSCMPTAQQKYLLLEHDLVRGDAVTAVTTRCFGHSTQSCNDARPRRFLRCTGDDCQQARPTYRGEDGAGITASDAWTLRFDVAGAKWAQCKVTDTGGGALSTIAITQRSTTE